MVGGQHRTDAVPQTERVGWTRIRDRRCNRPRLVKGRIKLHFVTSLSSTLVPLVSKSRANPGKGNCRYLAAGKGCLLGEGKLREAFNPGSIAS